MSEIYTNNESPPLLSIFLASYNQVKYINSFLNGWKSQTFQNFEIIAVDNFSTDGTAELLKDYPKVKLLQKKSTAAEAWLIALSYCRGKYLVIATTSDYICSHSWAERAITALENDTELSMVWSSGIHIFENGWFEGIYGYRFFKSPPPAKKEYLSYWMNDDYIPELGSMISAKVYRECILDFINKKNDITFFTTHFRYEFTARGYLQMYIPDLAFAGRTHPNQFREIWYEKEFTLNQLLKNKKNALLKELILNRKYFKFYDRNGNVIGQFTIKERLLIIPRIIIYKIHSYFIILIQSILKVIR